MQTKQLTWHTEERKVDALLPHKKTPRKISKDQAERVLELALSLVIPRGIEPRLQE